MEQAAEYESQTKINLLKRIPVSAPIGFLVEKVMAFFKQRPITLGRNRMTSPSMS